MVQLEIRLLTSDANGGEWACPSLSIYIALARRAICLFHNEIMYPVVASGPTVVPIKGSDSPFHCSNGVVNVKIQSVNQYHASQSVCSAPLARGELVNREGSQIFREVIRLE